MSAPLAPRNQLDLEHIAFRSFNTDKPCVFQAPQRFRPCVLANSSLVKQRSGQRDPITATEVTPVSDEEPNCKRLAGHLGDRRQFTQQNRPH